MEIRCPSCRRLLPCSGEVNVNGRILGVYQCDSCVRPWEFGGKVFETALTFALTENGDLVDVESGQPLQAG